MSKNSGNNSAKASGGSSGSAAAEKFPNGPKTTRSAMANGWGDRRNFQLSMGLKMDPDSIEEGNHILDSLIASDREEYEELQRADNSKK